MDLTQAAAGGLMGAGAAPNAIAVAAVGFSTAFLAALPSQYHIQVQAGRKPFRAAAVAVIHSLRETGRINQNMYPERPVEELRLPLPPPVRVPARSVPTLPLPSDTRPNPQISHRHSDPGQPTERWDPDEFSDVQPASPFAGPEIFDTTIPGNPERTTIHYPGTVQIRNAEAHAQDPPRAFYTLDQNSHVVITPGANDMNVRVETDTAYHPDLDVEEEPQSPYHTDATDSIERQIRRFQRQQIATQRALDFELRNQTNAPEQGINPDARTNGSNQAQPQSRRGSLVQRRTPSGEPMVDSSPMLQISENELKQKIANAQKKVVERVVIPVSLLSKKVRNTIKDRIDAIHKVLGNPNSGETTNLEHTPEPTQEHTLESQNPFDSSPSSPDKDPPTPSSYGPESHDSGEEEYTMPHLPSVPKTVAKSELIHWNVPWIILGLLILREAYARYIRDRKPKEKNIRGLL